MATDILVLSDLTADYDQFMDQFNQWLSARPVWKGVLTTMTSQTLLGLISTVGVHAQGRLIRAREDSFAETAQADDAIRAITQMQGARMTRKAPAEIRVQIESPQAVSLVPYTQFIVGGKYYFNREQIVLEANVPVEHYLYQGTVVVYQVTGNGANFQAFISEEDRFVVSDFDTTIMINGTLLNKASSVLWNYRDQPAFADLTLADGRLLIQFGTINPNFGSVPAVNDVVMIRYVVTEGDSGNNAALLNKRLNVDGFPLIEGTVLENPHGGADEQPVVVYKNVASGSFGTNESSVTRNQYVAIVNTYPGIVDAITQAQREIDPMDRKWMNTIRVSALTNSPWSQQQKADFIDYMERVTMYSTRFYWQDPIPMPRDLNIDVYAFNTAILSQVKQRSEDAVRYLFEPKTGLLLTDFYNSDLVTAIKKKNQGQVSYVLINEPTYPMTVSPPSGIRADYEIIPGGGTLTELVYAYAISVNDALEEGPPNKWVFPQVIGNNAAIKLRWRTTSQAVSYYVWGRDYNGGLGKIATVANTTDQFLEFTDDGSITPVGPLPPSVSSAPIRYNSLNSLTINVFYADRQQQIDGTPERNVTT